MGVITNNSLTEVTEIVSNSEVSIDELIVNSVSVWKKYIFAESPISADDVVVYDIVQLDSSNVIVSYKDSANALHVVTGLINADKSITFDTPLLIGADTSSSSMFKMTDSTVFLCYNNYTAVDRRMVLITVDPATRAVSFGSTTVNSDTNVLNITGISISPTEAIVAFTDRTNYTLEVVKCTIFLGNSISQGGLNTLNTGTGIYTMPGRVQLAYSNGVLLVARSQTYFDTPNYDCYIQLCSVSGNTITNTATEQVLGKSGDFEVTDISDKKFVLTFTDNVDNWTPKAAVIDGSSDMVLGSVTKLPLFLYNALYLGRWPFAVKTADNELNFFYEEIYNSSEYHIYQCPAIVKGTTIVVGERVDTGSTATTNTFYLSMMPVTYADRCLGAFSSGGNDFTVFSASKLALKMYIPNGTILSNFSLDPSVSNVQGLAFDGTNLITCDYISDEIIVYDGISGTVLTRFPTPSEVTSGVTFDGTNLISCSPATGIHIHDGISSTILDSFPPEGGYLTGIAFDGTNLISCDAAANAIYIHDGISATIKSSFDAPDGFVQEVAFDGVNLVSTGISTNRLYVHNGLSPDIITSFPLPESGYAGLTFANGNLLSGGANNDTVYVHDKELLTP